MIFRETKLAGAFIVEPERLVDERGFFARTWSVDEFAGRGLDARLVQCNTSFNLRRGTLRGMHFQIKPRAETKLVRCTMGAIYDVIVDLRSASRTFKQWAAFELTAGNRAQLYIPEGFAHGFQTLTDNTEVFYQMSEFYAPEYARGVRSDDAAFNVEWMIEEKIVSDKDRTYADFNEREVGEYGF